MYMCGCIYTFKYIYMCMLGIHVHNLYDASVCICMYVLVLMYGCVCCMNFCVYVLGMCVYVECMYMDIYMYVCWICSYIYSHVCVKELMCMVIQDVQYIT